MEEFSDPSELVGNPYDLLKNAVAQKNIPLIQLLLEYDFPLEEVFEVDEQASSVLHTACRNRDAHVLKLLLNSRQCNGIPSSVMFEAIREQSLQCFKLLVTRSQVS